MYAVVIPFRNKVIRVFISAVRQSVACLPVGKDSLARGEKKKGSLARRQPFFLKPLSRLYMYEAG